MNDQEFREHVIESLASNTATLDSVKENQEKGFNWFKQSSERIERESRERDDAHSAKIQGIETKLTYFMGAGATAGFGLGVGIKYLLGKLGIHLD